MKPHVVVGMSGGVDSSVTALLLLRQGYRVSGLFMKNWEEDDGTEYCTAAQDFADAKQVCERLGVELHTVNFAAEYWDEVFEVFLSEYRAGRTPNPDILCNKQIKFRAFLDYAEDLGADLIAMGHYARVAEEEGRLQLLKGCDAGKDQSYFLYTLQQEQLARTLFPLGGLRKTEVRALAAGAGFANDAKKDSTGICFIGERRFKDFLARYLPARPGDIRTPEGVLLGRHDGLMYYTLGQRSGLGIGGTRAGGQEPWYVLDKDLARNVLVVGQGHDHPLLYRDGLLASRLHWVDGAGPAPGEILRCAAKTRYRQSDQDCRIRLIGEDRLEVVFAQPQRAVTPGQSVVFYQDDCCLGGGVIDLTFNADSRADAA
ncbi:tRNA 2-thiouridine(34) synthase MnmA [Methylococcus capsulatus]|uniref:tRNA 2-thiouridine(34) synthase MnmA n=1 Tax=Methylococcus capsulatus TaxID=414 RepID=UPI001C52DF9C|nr:tRNA 2-thiouridine(34) synthase MnmA [Methylococcus capsulatus]QXP87565.1 tRNA 2-thiouridine(34) synthase MnmA [Methylococcus capsulatus]QXP91079.1 tRNA 2-thiouridine(34) synthase MnmA [Methylococcus capsulatus]QXP92695.1 tRNA 2-thiouridine(34) synthase MnmA [Methylococcus capsulatus]UQN12579.1 tRNA 2-thiouridine(34) synthase MnmA [Methylococcus capsulatus]